MMNKTQFSSLGTKAPYAEPQCDVMEIVATVCSTSIPDDDDPIDF